jgi:type I restriction enzyme S subunit
VIRQIEYLKIYELESKFISEEKADELKAHIITAGDVLITKIGDPPGDSDLCPEHFSEAVITADSIKLRVDTDIANNKFVMYAIKS